MTPNLELEIFRAGDYGDKGSWGEGELDQLAADYDPALHEAPVTLDHARQLFDDFAHVALGETGAGRDVREDLRLVER